jgi:hypothetical protein
LGVIFSFFRTSKNRQFTYRPLYYQPEADAQSSRPGLGKTHLARAAASRDVGENDASTEARGKVEQDHQQHRAALRFRRQLAQQEAQQSNRRLLFIIFIMFSLVLLLFGELKKLMYLLPVFVPLLWWTFRRAANKITSASGDSEHHRPA